MVKVFIYCKDLEIAENYSPPKYRFEAQVDLLVTEDLIVPAWSTARAEHRAVVFFQSSGGSTEGEPLPCYTTARSSTAASTPLRLSHPGGVVDFEFRGELSSFWDDFSDQEYKVRRGERYHSVVPLTSEPLTGFFVNDKEIAVSTIRRGGRGIGSSGQGSAVPQTGGCEPRKSKGWTACQTGLGSGRGLETMYAHS